jgi:hypothetical protein
VVSQEAAQAAKERHSGELLQRPEVCGVGTARRSDGWVVQVHVEAGRDAPELPVALDGVPVELVSDGPFIAGPAKGPAR